ncbi:MAG: hypothetical protein QOG20_6843 [Pseudonocardiales bacterium]|nr:hypothetical protein [Pseudonocardiales bacterium]
MALKSPYVLTHTEPASTGRPASSASSDSRRVDSEVSSDGLRTTVLPAASAGATLIAAWQNGKFHGVMAATTPSGRRVVNTCAEVSTTGTTAPVIFVCHPA